MADKKIEKALYGPSIMEVALGALLGFLLGAVLAVVYLVWKPEQQVMQLPKDLDPKVVYLVPGAENSTKGRNWQAKLKTLSSGGAANFIEEELNAFAATLAPPAAGAPDKPGGAPDKPGEPAKPANPADLFSATGLNFRILKSDQLQISAKCALTYFGIGIEVLVKATGTFARSGDHVIFQPDTFFLGSCPLHKLPMSSEFVIGRILASYKLPDSMRSWDKISSIKVEGGQLKVTALP